MVPCPRGTGSRSTGPTRQVLRKTEKMCRQVSDLQASSADRAGRRHHRFRSPWQGEPLPRQARVSVFFQMEIDMTSGFFPNVSVGMAPPSIYLGSVPSIWVMVFPGSVPFDGPGHREDWRGRNWVTRRAHTLNDQPKHFSRNQALLNLPASTGSEAVLGSLMHLGRGNETDVCGQGC